MKTLFTAPVWWSEQIVGSLPRFWITVVAQTAGVLFFCWMSEWRYVGPMIYFGAVMPVYYLIALRGLIRELHRKTGPHEKARFEGRGSQEGV